MRIDKCQGPNKRFAPWIILCVLTLFTAIIFILPSVVFAEITGELSQDCDQALIGNEHTISAKVTHDGAPGPGEGVVAVFFKSTDPTNFNKYLSGAVSFDDNGIATFAYTHDSVEQVEVTLFYVGSDYMSKALGKPITTDWTDDQDAELCSESPPESPGVTVGGRTILNVNAKKHQTLRIAVCATDGLDVDNVDLKTVQLAGVAPWHAKRRDSWLCPNGKDGVRDLVLKFKNREIVQSLEESLGELEDGQEVGLAFTGSLNDGTPLEGEWLVVIKDKSRKHWKKKHKEKIKEKCKGKKDKKK